MKMDRDSLLYTIIHRYFRALGRANTANLFGPKSLSGNFDEVEPIDPNKRDLPELDNGPQAVEERTKAARNSLLVPLAVIAGVIAIFAIAILLRTH